MRSSASGGRLTALSCANDEQTALTSAESQGIPLTGPGPGPSLRGPGPDPSLRGPGLGPSLRGPGPGPFDRCALHVCVVQ